MAFGAWSWFFAAAAGLCLVLRFALSGRAFDATGLFYVLAPFHALGFHVRNALGGTARRMEHANEPKKGLFAHAGRKARALERRELELRTAYYLGPLQRASSRRTYRENLYVLDLLDRVVQPHLHGVEPGRSVRALDVGSKDFEYAFALARFLRHGSDRRPRAVDLVGVEIDGRCLHRDGNTRADHGAAFAQAAGAAPGSDVRYAVGDVLDRADRDLDVVFLFCPFVLEYALVRWGLPRSCFAPARIMRHVHDALRPGGLVVVVNHTEEEHVAQRILLAGAGFEILAGASAVSELVDYADEIRERRITVARRRATP